MELVQCLVVRKLSGGEQAAPVGWVFFPAQVQLLPMPDRDLLDVVRSQFAEQPDYRGRHSKQKGRCVWISAGRRPRENQGLAHQVVGQFRRQAPGADRSQSAATMGARPLPPFDIEKLRIHEQKRRRRRATTGDQIQLSPKSPVLVNDLNAGFKQLRVCNPNERFNTSFIQLANEPQCVCTLPLRRRQGGCARRCAWFVSKSRHGFRLGNAPANILTLGFEKCVSGFAGVDARCTVRTLPRAECRNQGKGRR